MSYFDLARQKLLQMSFLTAIIGLVVSSGQAGVINVSLGNRVLYTMVGKPSNDYSQSTTPGTAAPLAYSGNTWNEYSVVSPSASGLLTSEGVATSVGFSVSGYKSTVGDHGGSGILTLLGAGLHADGPSTTGGYYPDNNTLPSLTLTGLNDNWNYRLVIISGGNYNNKNEWNIGGTPTFSSPSTPTGFIGGTSLITTSSTSQRSTWVKDVNYVVFENVHSVGGSLTVRDRAIIDKFSINGFQLEGTPQVPEPTSMAIFGLGVLGMAAYRARRNTNS